MTAWPRASALGFTSLLAQDQAVPYTSVANAGNVPLTLSTVVFTPVAIRERQVSFGVYKWQVTTFKIDPAVWTAAAAAGGIPTAHPKPRDLLTGPTGIVWRVYRAMSPSINGTIWRLVCNSLIIEASLCDTISILKPVDSTDAYMSPLTAQGVPSGPETNMPCRIQFEREYIDDFQGVQFMREEFKIYVQNLDDSLAIGTVIVVTGLGNARTDISVGTIFRVISNDNIEQLEELEVLTCTIDPVA